jgi:hypothetical protein
MSRKPRNSNPRGDEGIPKESTLINTKNNIISQALGDNGAFKHKGQRTRNPGRDSDEERSRWRSG